MLYVILLQWNNSMKNSHTHPGVDSPASSKWTSNSYWEYQLILSCLQFICLWGIGIHLGGRWGLPIGRLGIFLVLNSPWRWAMRSYFETLCKGVIGNLWMEMTFSVFSHWFFWKSGGKCFKNVEIERCHLSTLAPWRCRKCAAPAVPAATLSGYTSHCTPTQTQTAAPSFFPNNSCCPA